MKKNNNTLKTVSPCGRMSAEAVQMGVLIWLVSDLQTRGAWTAKRRSPFVARITPLCNNHVTKRLNVQLGAKPLLRPQNKHASSSGLHQVRAAQAAQRLHCLRLLLQSSSLSSYSSGSGQAPFTILKQCVVTLYNLLQPHSSAF